jgi:molecular chaperone DnaJ
LRKRSYYEILEIPFAATQQEIKKTYHRLALKHHPDRHPEAKSSEELFKKITEAYGVLGNPQKRSKYDQHYTHSSRTTGYDFRSKTKNTCWCEPSSELLRDVFRDILGHPITPKNKAQKGEDLRYHLSVPFEVAALGKETEIEVPYFQLCTACRGLKMKPGTGFKKCPRCKGKGKVKRKKGKSSLESVCRKCKGEAKIIEKPCLQCEGEGKIKLLRSLAFKIPPGVMTGTRIRVTGRGHPGLNGGFPGDLYVVINVEPHHLLEREENDINCHLLVSFSQASLGAQIEIPTLKGKTFVKIPPGTQSGEIVRLKNKGISLAQGTKRGDQKVIVEVKIPSRLTTKQKRLLRQFARIS